MAPDGDERDPTRPDGGAHADGDLPAFYPAVLDWGATAAFVSAGLLALGLAVVATVDGGVPGWHWTASSTGRGASAAFGVLLAVAGVGLVVGGVRFGAGRRRARASGSTDRDREARAGVVVGLSAGVATLPVGYGLAALGVGVAGAVLPAAVAGGVAGALSRYGNAGALRSGGLAGAGVVAVGTVLAVGVAGPLLAFLGEAFVASGGVDPPTTFHARGAALALIGLIGMVFGWITWAALSFVSAVLGAVAVQRLTERTG